MLVLKIDKGNLLRDHLSRELKEARKQTMQVSAASVEGVPCKRNPVCKVLVLDGASGAELGGPCG